MKIIILLLSSLYLLVINTSISINVSYYDTLNDSKKRDYIIQNVFLPDNTLKTPVLFVPNSIVWTSFIARHFNINNELPPADPASAELTSAALAPDINFVCPLLEYLRQVNFLVVSITPYLHVSLTPNHLLIDFSSNIASLDAEINLPLDIMTILPNITGPANLEVLFIFADHTNNHEARNEPSYIEKLIENISHMQTLLPQTEIHYSYEFPLYIEHPYGLWRENKYIVFFP